MLEDFNNFFSRRVVMKSFIRVAMVAIVLCGMFACVCSNAQAQSFYNQTGVTYHNPNVVQTSPVLQLAPVVQPIKELVPVTWHPDVPIPKKSKVTKMSVDGVGTITTTRYHEFRSDKHKITERHQDRNGDTHERSYWLVEDHFEFSQRVEIPQIGMNKILNSYDEVMSYEDGKIKRCRRTGWSIQTDGNPQHWERKFVWDEENEWTMVKDGIIEDKWPERIELPPKRLPPVDGRPTPAAELLMPSNEADTGDGIHLELGPSILREPKKVSSYSRETLVRLSDSIEPERVVLTRK
jgi:hypothetical protein